VRLCISCLLLCNKSPPSWWLETSTHSLSHGFCSSGVWPRLSWVLCLETRKVVLKVSTGCPSVQALGEEPPTGSLESLCCRTGGRASLLAAGWGFTTAPGHVGFPSMPISSSQQGEPLQQVSRRTQSQKQHPITPAVSYCKIQVPLVPCARDYTRA